MSDEKEQQDAESRIHHPYSPSTLQNLETCPSYEGLSRTHIRAIAGTKAHKVTETLVDDNSLDDDDAEAAAECLDFYYQRKQLMELARQKDLAECIERYLLENPTFNREQVIAKANEKCLRLVELQETYLPVDDEIFDDPTAPLDGSNDKWKEGFRRILGTTAGYFDRAIISHDGKYAEAMDWKFGLWPVEKTENNLQAISYVLGLFKRFPTLEKIRFWFKQPAIGVLDDHLFLREQIPALYLRVRVVVARAREARASKDFSTASPAIPVCLFCKWIGQCPKVTDFACKVGKKFTPLQIPEHITPSMVQDPKNTSLGMKLAQVVGVWSDAFKQVTADRVLRGAPLPEGYELRSREGSRKVVDMKSFKVEALKTLTEEEFESTLDVSIGAVEKAIGNKTPRGMKKGAIQTFKATLEEKNITERGNGCCFLQAKND